MTRKCSCEKDCYTTFENLGQKIENLHECENCKDIQIKKFSPLNDLINFDELTKDYQPTKSSKFYLTLFIVMSVIALLMAVAIIVLLTFK